MNAYEAKQEARRERYLEIAEKKRTESEEVYEATKKRADLIPFGQPILIGHHSQRRAERDAERIRNGMIKSIKLSETADYYEHRAENMSNSISSDDPDAIIKLKTKLEELEKRQEFMKKENLEARKKKEEKPHPTWQLSNNSNNMRTVKQRIEQLEKSRNMEVREDMRGNGWTLHEDKEQNRIQFLFEAIPGEEIRKTLKSRGFRWSPYNKAWQRQLNGNGRLYAKYVIDNVLI